MSNNIYDILGKLNGLLPKQNPDITDKEPVYESVEPKGDIMEAVRQLEEKYQGFKKEIAKESKEEYCDACDSTECKCDCDESIEEGKEFKNKEEFDKFAKTGDSYKTEKGRVTKTDSGVKHERSYAGDDSDKDLDESAKPDYLDLDKDGNKTEPMKKAAKDAKELDEVAPPGAKAERMVKHIKKGYAKDGKLTKKEKGIAYATAWKAHNKGQVEEATEFGDTIENSKAEMSDAKKYVTEGDIRNHPIYTTQEAWDHYSKELAEQEMQEEIVVDAVEELDEIARLAGLPTSEPIVEKTLDETTAIEEAATRKDFRAVANLLKNIPDEAKRKELAHHHADVFKQQNPRFKKEMFLAAAGVTEGSCTMEDEVEEGNEFSGALAQARASGAKEFEVDGKKYTVKEDINLNVTATGEEDVVNLIRKLSGMPVVAVQATPQVEAPCAEQAVEEERDIEYVNTPREQVAGIDAAIPSGTDLNRSKVQDPHTANKAANPLAEQAVEETLWKKYEAIINDIKA